MPEVSKKVIDKLPNKQLLKMVNRLKKKIKNHPVVVDMFKEYDVGLEEIDLIPMIFSDLDVSAQTNHGIIYLNKKLLEDGDYDKDDHYLVHEITHFLQQTTGDGPTQGSDDGDYLKNKYEQEGFQRQTEYMSDEYGKDVAEEYIEKVLDHHDEDDPKERKEKKDSLLSFAMARTLYHGTSIDRARSIVRDGLIPQVGPWVESGYGHAMSLDPEDEDYEGLREKPVFDLSFAANKHELSKAIGGMRAAIADELGKNFSDVTEEDIRALGALIVIREADDFKRSEPLNDEPGNVDWDSDYDPEVYPTVEPGDYFTQSKQDASYVLTGSKLMNVLKKHFAWDTSFGEEQIKQQRERLIRHFINKGNDRDEVLEELMYLDDDTIKEIYKNTFGE